MQTRTIAGCLVALALMASPEFAAAQRRGRGRRGGGGAAAQPTEQPAQPAGGAAAGGGGDSGAMTFTTEEAQQPAQPDPNAGGAAAGGAAGGEAGGAAASGGGSGLEGIGGADVRAVAHPLRENIAAVQQIYALRNRRLELQPSVAFSLNDPFVSHTGASLGANFWITNVLAIGVSFMWNGGLNSRADVDLRLARSTRLGVPINEYQFNTALNFTYVPIYGKFLMFNRYIFHWDIYLMAGVGITRTRPIAVIDPEVRTFDWNISVMFNAGAGIRVFLTRWLGIFAEVRNYVYSERVESTDTSRAASPFGTAQAGSRQDPAFWYGQNRITDNVMLQAGLTFFLPPGVTYRLQK